MGGGSKFQFFFSSSGWASTRYFRFLGKLVWSIPSLVDRSMEIDWIWFWLFRSSPTTEGGDPEQDPRYWEDGQGLLRSQVKFVFPPYKIYFFIF